MSPPKKRLRNRSGGTSTLKKNLNFEQEISLYGLNECKQTADITLSIDHGKLDELGSGPNWKKIARFKRL